MFRILYNKYSYPEYTRIEGYEFESFEEALEICKEMEKDGFDSDYIIENPDNEIRMYFKGSYLAEVECPVCNNTFMRMDMEFTNDCHGIPFRLVCHDCYNEIMSEKGYDGEYYDAFDEIF